MTDTESPRERNGSEVLSFDDASKRFPDGTVAVEDVSLIVKKGEFVALLGPSGCGKSTLLRIASSLDVCTSGSCTVGTERLGYVFQDATLLPWRTVDANVRLFAELHGLSREETVTRSRKALGLVGLENVSEKYPHQLSGGMKMRVSLARSLVLEPDLFLFDEPFGALDEMTRSRLNAELIRLHMEIGFTSVFVTHSVQEAVYLSTRVVVLAGRPGRVVASFDVPFDYPRPTELRYQPAFAALCGEIATALRDSDS